MRSAETCYFLPPWLSVMVQQEFYQMRRFGRSGKMMCSKVIEKLSFYVDGALDEQTLEMMEAHLAGCPGCRRELASLRLLVTTAGEIDPVQPPPSLRYRIFESLREARAQERRCAQVSGLLSAYADGELSTKQTGLVEAHVSFCDRCAQELQAIRMIAGAAGSVTPIEPPADMRARIAAAIAHQSGQSLVGSVLRRLRTALHPVAAKWVAGAATAAALAVTLMISMPQAPKQTNRAPVARKSAAPTSTAAVAVSPKPVARDEVAAAERRRMTIAYRPSTRREARRARRRPVILASALRTAKPRVALPRAKPAAKSNVPDVSATNTADASETANVDTKPVVVAAASLPAPETRPETKKPSQPAMVRVASAPMSALGKVQEMMEQFRAEAAMRRSEARSATVAIFSSRF